MALLAELLLLAGSSEAYGVLGKSLHLIERANTFIPNNPQRFKLLLKKQRFDALIPEAEEQDYRFENGRDTTRTLKRRPAEWRRKKKRTVSKKQRSTLLHVLFPCLSVMYANRS